MARRCGFVAMFVLLVAGCGGSLGAQPRASAALTGGTGGVEMATTGARGTVTDGVGAPVPAATVDRRPVGGSGPVTQQAAVTGPDGRWSWALPPGTYDIVVTAPGGHAAGRVVVGDGTPAVLDLVLLPG